MKTCVVTGATSGVGRATVRELARSGWAIGLVARGEEALEATAKEVDAAGGHALILPADVANAEEVDAAAEQAEASLGPIELWVNDAMTSVFAPFTDMSADEFRRVTEVDYLGFVWGTMAALRRMLPRDRGVVVQVGSALAYRGIPLQSAYCGAKHAIQGFNESLRCELLHRRSHVRVTMVQLPALNTPQFDVVESKLPHAAQPVPPIYQPEVAARAVVWAANHPQRRETWVGGSTAATIAANALAPGVLDRYLGRTGFDAQQTPEPARPRPSNLWEPVPGDPGAHGRFDGRAHGRSAQQWFSRHHRALGAGLAVAAAVWGVAHDR